MSKVIVTGGSGFVGTNLQQKKPKWEYPSSSELNLEDYQATKNYLHHMKQCGFDTVVHLAGQVGGIKDNNNKQVKYFEKNLVMNYNIVRACRELNFDRLLCSLSTCIFPDVMDEYPMTEENIMDGPPQETNYSYAIAKRSMFAHVKACREDGYDFSCFTPSNIYGPHDNFGESGHFVAALVKKVYQAEEKIDLWGTGKPLRQFLYVKDLVDIIPRILSGVRKFSGDNIIIAPNENISIDDAANKLIDQVDKDLEICYNGKLDGQYRKDCSNSLLKKTLMQEYDFTSFEEGIKETYEWYAENSNH